MRRKGILILVLVAIIGVIGYNYLYQDHRSISEETPQFSMSSEDFASQFSLDIVAGEQKFIDKTIEVKGVITEINEYDLTLDDMVFCQFSEKLPTANQVNDELVVKGRCIGYDDLLEQVKINECSIIK